MIFEVIILTISSNDIEYSQYYLLIITCILRWFIMYDVCDVSRYIINYSNEKDYFISNLKLQKLLYFVQAVYVNELNRKCFDEAIEAWNFGPVAPKAYREFKMYGCNSIPKIASYFKFDEDNVWNTHKVKFNKDIIAQDDQVMINRIVDIFAEYSSTDLVYITQNQLPWENAYLLGKNTEITLNSLKEYFGMHTKQDSNNRKISRNRL